MTTPIDLSKLPGGCSGRREVPQKTEQLQKASGLVELKAQAGRTAKT